jgi:hypothetical protein
MPSVKSLHCVQSPLSFSVKKMGGSRNGIGKDAQLETRDAIERDDHFEVIVAVLDVPAKATFVVELVVAHEILLVDFHAMPGTDGDGGSCDCAKKGVSGAGCAGRCRDLWR